MGEYILGGSMYQTTATCDKRRILGALTGKKTDRVPNFEVLVDDPTLSHIMGRQIEGSHTLDNIRVDDYMEFARRVGQDAVGLCFYDNPFLASDGEGPPKPRDFRITCRLDLERLVYPSLDHLRTRFDQLAQYRAATEKSELALFALTGSFFCDAYDSVFGFENFMYLLHDDPMLIEDYLEMHANYYVEQVREIVKCGIDFLYIGDDIAYKGGTMLSPETMRRIWVPRMRRIMAPAAECGVPILFHSDGNILEMLPDLLDMGIGGLNPIEPYGMDIADVKKRFGANIALFGNLDVGAVLAMGTPDTVRAAARNLIDTVGKDGGLVMSSSHSITKDVLPENYIAMIETAQQYGRY